MAHLSSIWLFRIVCGTNSGGVGYANWAKLLHLYQWLEPTFKKIWGPWLDTEDFKMSAVPLEIRLLRKEGSDDIICISPVVNAFKISYTDGVAKSNHFFYANDQEVVRYVEDLFYLLVDDIDPFTSIQFLFPCFPSVLYKIPDFDMSHIRRTIRDRLVATLYNWPERFRSTAMGFY